MTAVDRTLEAIELIKVVKGEEPDEVDSLKLVDQDGVECLFSPEDCGPEEIIEDAFTKDQNIADFWGLL